MYQLPVNNLTRLRRARKQVKKALSDIGLEYCKDHVEDLKEFCPDDLYVKNTVGLDICSWDPSFSRTQEYRSKPFCCTECSFSSKYYSGYKNHFRNVHRQNFESRILLNCPYCTFTASKRTMETHVKIFHVPSSPRQGQGAYQGTVVGQKDKTRQVDNVERAMYFCKKCSYRDPLYNVVRRHIYREHFKHVVSPYVAMVSESSLKNGANTVNGNNILCKRCQFSTRSYEALVQHVIEYHERIGSQVTTMIGHANVVMSRSQAYSLMAQKPPMVTAGGRAVTSEQLSHMMGSHLKQGPSGLKNLTTQSSIPGHQVRVTVPGSNGLGEGPLVQPAGSTATLSTSQTQKWKICTVCNELFPESLYSAHFEKAHKAKKVWAMAKYIMKIHNFTSKCLLCNRYLPSDTLLNHMLIHGLSCPQCHSTFNNVEKMLEHVGQNHPDDFVGPPAASPLTFDLTIKHDKPKNIQLIVITFNMKEPVSSQEQSLAAHASNTLSAPVKTLLSKMPERKNETPSRSMLQATVSGDQEVGKSLCPLCFTILKGSVTDALALHLRERHQVLQTMHPVEKKMTYKCIHCLGVYTSNMVASTITLHLVQCRAVGRSQKGQGIKSALTLNSSGAGFLKRQLPAQTTPDPKRMKMNDEVAYSPSKPGESVDLVLDPRSYEHMTYEARKAFLTTYFNQRPYLSSLEEEKLSSSLWLWKSDIASHFANRRRTCERECETRRVSVLLGFDMQALRKLKHDMNFEEVTKPSGTSVVSSNLGGLKSAPKTDQSKQCETINCTLKLSAYTQPISIDSDSEPEQEISAENGSMDSQQHVISSQEANLSEEGNSSTGIDGPSREESTLQDAKSNAWVTLC